MAEIVFTDRTTLPDDASLAETLGESYSWYKKLLEIAAEWPREWKYYNRKSGWTLKILHKKKALCYIAPSIGCFMLGMTLNEREKRLLLDGELDDQVKEILSMAQKYPEGYALRLTVRARGDCERVIAVWRVLQKL